MPWVALVLIGACLNVITNYGYKVSAHGLGPEWIAAGVMVVTSAVLLMAAVIRRRAGWGNLLRGSTPYAIVAMGLTVGIIFPLFIKALALGPLSLVDPLWACVYALVSLLIGMMIIHERPTLAAIAGIIVYLAGAGLMGILGYQGDGGSGVWVFYVLIGASLNAIVNYGYKTYAVRVDIFQLMGCVYVVTALTLIVYGLTSTPSGLSALFTGAMPWVVLAMGFATPCFVVMMITALVRGPIALVDPLWACVYGLGSVVLGMVVLAERPAIGALIGVVLYIAGAFLMARYGPATRIAEPTASKQASSVKTQ